MNFLSPINEDLVEYSNKLSNQTIGKKVLIHSHKHGFPNLTKVKFAFFTFSSNYSKNQNFVTENFRKLFYKLFFGNWDFAIADICVLQQGNKIEDSNAAIQEIVSEMNQRNILCLMIGGKKELSYALYHGLKEKTQNINITSIDSEFNFINYDNLKELNFISKIINETNNHLGNFSNIGYQSFYVSQEEIDLMNKLSFDYYRLGEITKDIQEAEPVLRESDIVSVNLCSVKSSELNYDGNPNGFNSQQLCALMRYAGLSYNLKILGLFNIPNTKSSCQLIAQIVWYIIDGSCYKLLETPKKKSNNFIKYMVTYQNNEIIFYKSKLSQRWWMQIPDSFDNNNNKEYSLLACTEKDYRTAQVGQLPDRLLKSIKRSMH